MASKRALPSDIPGEGGGPKGVNEQVGALWDTLFQCCFFNAFSDAILEPLDVILEPLGRLGHFWDLVLGF